MGSMMTRIFRLYVMLLLGAVCLTLLLTIVPFFMYGLHLQPSSAVALGAYDPKSFPPFAGNTPLSIVVYWFAILLLVFVPLWAVPLSLVTASITLRFRPQISARLQYTALLAVLAGAGLTLFSFTSLGRLLLVWLLD